MEQLKNKLRLPNSPQMVYEDFTPSSDWTQDSNCHVLLVDLPGFKREELKVQVDNMRKVTVSGERQLSENKFSRFSQIYEMPQDSDIDSISGRFDGGVLFIIIPKKKTDQAQHPKPEIRSADDTEQEVKDNNLKGKDDDVNKFSHENRHDQKHEEPKRDDVNKKKDELDGKEHKQHDNSFYPHDEKKQEIAKNELRDLLKEERRMIRKNWEKLTVNMKNKEELKVLMKTAMETLNKNKTTIITAVVAFTIGLYISRK